MVKGKKPQQMNMWQRRYLKAAVLNVGKNGDKEGSKDRVRKSLINFFKKLLGLKVLTWITASNPPNSNRKNTWT